MKKLFIVAVLLLGSLGANAQTIGLTIKAGAGCSNICGSNLSGNKVKFNWKAGVGYEIPVTTDFFVEPSLLFNSKGYKIDGGKTINADYLELPIMAGYRVAAGDKMNVVFNAGPYIACGVAGTKNVFKDEGYRFKRFDCGVGAAVKYEISSFVIGADFSYGITKAIKDTKAHNITYGITLGYKI